MKHTFTSHLVMIAEMKIKPEKLEEFIDYTLANLKVCRSYPGNIEFDILIDEAHPESVRFYEVWESTVAQRAYMAWRVETGDLVKLLSLIAEEPKFTALRSIAN